MVGWVPRCDDSTAGAIPLGCLFSEWRKASINQGDTILHYKRVPVVAILWVLQPPSEVGHQSGNFYGKEIHVSQGLLYLQSWQRDWPVPHTSAACLLPGATTQWQPLPALRLPGPLRRKGRIPHPFWPNIVLSSQVLTEFLVKTAGSQLILVGLVLFCKFCVNSLPLSSLSLLLLLLLSTPLGVWQPLDDKFEPQTKGSNGNALLQPSWKMVTLSGMHDGFSSQLPWS